MRGKVRCCAGRFTGVCLVNSLTALTDEEAGSGTLRGLLYLHHKPRGWGIEGAKGATLGEDVGCPSAIFFFLRTFIAFIWFSGEISHRA